MTNTVFGFLRCYVLLAVAAGAGGVAAGYGREQLAAALLHGPAGCCSLDEPTIGLDVVSKQAVRGS